MVVINIILDNARYHHAKLLQPWLESPERRVKLHFLPPYAPHLNPESAYGLSCPCGLPIINTTPPTTNLRLRFVKFFRESLPENWKEIRDTVSDNFCVFSTSQYKIMEKRARTGYQAWVRLIARAGSAGKKQAAEQVILRLNHNYNRKRSSECTGISRYGPLRLTDACASWRRRPL